MSSILSRRNITIFLIFLGIILALIFALALYFLVYDSKWDDFKNTLIIICCSLAAYILTVPIIGYCIIPIISIIYNIRSDLKRKSLKFDTVVLNKLLEEVRIKNKELIKDLTELRGSLGELLVEDLGDNTEEYLKFSRITDKDNYKILLYKSDFSDYIISSDEYKDYLSMIKRDAFNSDKNLKFFYKSMKIILKIFFKISENNKLIQKTQRDLEKINKRIKNLVPLPE